MPSDADADARRRRVAELRAECERLRDENDLFEIHLARIAPPGTEQAPEEDAEDAGAKRSKGSKKSKAKTDAPVVRDRLTDAERLDAVTAESELLERVQRETEAANERGLMNLRAACDEVDACLQELKKTAHDFKREVAIGAVNERTGLVDPTRWLRHSEHGERQADADEQDAAKPDHARGGDAAAEGGDGRRAPRGGLREAEDREPAVRGANRTRLKRQLDEAGARMRQLQADMDQKRYYMGTFDANLAVAEKEHAAAYKLNKNLLTASNSTGTLMTCT